MSRAQMKIYVYGDKDAQKSSVDLTEINKDWKDQDLDNGAYQDFAGKLPGKKAPVRGSQSVKRSRQGSRGS